MFVVGDRVKTTSRFDGWSTNVWTTSSYRSRRPTLHGVVLADSGEDSLRYLVEFDNWDEGHGGNLDWRAEGRNHSRWFCHADMLEPLTGEQLTLDFGGTNAQG